MAIYVDDLEAEHFNKVIFGGNTVIDLSGDTVTPDKLALGETAHDRDGEQITGTMVCDMYSEIVECAVGDTEVIFTDVTYSNTATYQVFSDEGTGLGVPITQIWYDSNNKVKATFFKPLRNVTSVYLKYWEN